MGMHRRLRGPRRLVPALVVMLLAVLAGGLAVATTHATRPAPTRPVATGSPTPLHRVDPARDQIARSPSEAAAAAVLARRARAVLQHDRNAFAATLDPRSPRFRASQLEMFANLAQVPLASWSYEIGDADPLPIDAALHARYGAAGVYAPSEVLLHYRLTGFDDRPTAQQEYLTFVLRGTTWYVASDSDFTSRHLESAEHLWDYGPVTVVRGQRCLVLGHPGSLATMRVLAAEADRDVPRVTAVWGDGWDQRAVLLVPASQQELTGILGGDEQLTQIAAVATAELGGDGHQRAPVGSRVLVNPPNFQRLGSIGRRVVVTHEITHVATRAQTGSAIPSWLVEGFADYVGWLGTGVPMRSAAQEVAAAVRAGHLPAALPSDAEFAGSNPHLAEVYGEAWLACRYIATRWGQDKLVELYRTLGGSEAPNAANVLTRALASVLHTTKPQLVQGWRAWLQAELS